MLYGFLKPKLRYWFLSIILAMLSNIVCAASNIISIDTQDLISCPADNSQKSPPNFDSLDCETLSFHQINPQNKHIWVKGNLHIPKDYLSLNQATAFFLFAKTSSEVYFNKTKIGQNGTPNTHSDNEFVGKMDVRFHVPRELLKVGDNEIILHLSSHHGLLDLSGPMHFAGIGEYGSSSSFFQQDILLSLLLFGVLLSGAVYLGAISLSSKRASHHRGLFLMMFFVLAQLFSEVSRGIFDYAYPVQDLRLIFIVGFSLGFGISFLWFFVNQFTQEHVYKWFMTGSLLTILSVLTIPGFDIKTAVAVFIPAVVITLLVGWQYLRSPNRKLLSYLCAFIVFDIVTCITLPVFHSMIFYCIITMLMVALFIKQARQLNLQKLQSEREQALISKLQFKLDQNEQQQNPSKITLNSAGKTELIDANLIIFCKAAGDYVEIVLSNDKSHLYSGSLKSIESQLPDTFIRVHRSYMVNLEYVNTLKSSYTDSNTATNGGGNLELNNLQEIPVSRRLMPQVRQAVKQSNF